VVLIAGEPTIEEVHEQVVAAVSARLSNSGSGILMPDAQSTAQ